MKNIASKLLTSFFISLSGLSYLPVNATVNIDLTNPKVSKVNNVSDFWNTVINASKYFVTGIMGILAIACVGTFAINCFKVAAASNSPAKRSEAIKGIMYSLIGIALFGSTTFFTGMAFNLFH